MISDFFRRIKKKLSVKASGAYRELEILIQHYQLCSDSPQVLYLGDSVVERIAAEDKDKRRLDQMVADELKGFTSSLSITHSAYHMKVYYHLVLALLEMKNKPKLIVVPVNMRSFSPQWDFEPSWQFEEEIDCLKRFVQGRYDQLSIRKADLSQKYEEFDAIPVSYPLSPLNQVGQFRLIISAKPATEAQKEYRSRQIFIFHYTHPLQKDHPKLRAMEELIQRVRESQIKLLFYVTPLNYQAGNRFVGSAFERVVRDNVETVFAAIAPYIKKGGVYFYDYSTLFEPDAFFHPNLATEHLNEKGRRLLAQRLSQKVLEILSGRDSRSVQ